MATHTLTHVATTGLTLYVFPSSQSLGDWATYRVQLSEAGSPNEGRYQGSVDDAQGRDWWLFIGATQPSSWDAAIKQYQTGVHVDEIAGVNLEEDGTGGNNIGDAS